MSTSDCSREVFCSYRQIDTGFTACEMGEGIAGSSVWGVCSWSSVWCTEKRGCVCSLVAGSSVWGTVACVCVGGME